MDAFVQALQPRLWCWLHQEIPSCLKSTETRLIYETHSTKQLRPFGTQCKQHMTTHSGYGTTPVWCRGGTRYVEGCWGFLTWKWKSFCRIYQISISCFLKHMKFISKIVNKCLQVFSSLPGAHLLKIWYFRFQWSKFQNSSIKLFILYIFKYPRFCEVQNFKKCT